MIDIVLLISLFILRDYEHLTMNKIHKNKVYKAATQTFINIYEINLKDFQTFQHLETMIIKNI